MARHFPEWRRAQTVNANRSLRSISGSWCNRTIFHQLTLIVSSRVAKNGGARLAGCSSQCASHHQERYPGERRRIIQEVSEYRWNQAPPSQEIGHTPQHAAKCSGDGDPEPRKETLVQIACVGKAERNAGN